MNPWGRSINNVQQNSIYTEFDLEKGYISPEILKLISPTFVAKYRILPYKLDNSLKILTVATDQLENLKSQKFLSENTGYSIEIKLVRDSESDALITAINRHYKLDREELINREQKGFGNIEVVEGENKNEDLADINQSEVSNLVNRIINDAVTMGGTDIHIDPHESGSNVFFRLDGILRVRDYGINEPLKRAVVNRIKIMMGMENWDATQPQDGSKTFKVQGKTVDFRVATIPTVVGEKVTIRILNRNNVILSLDRLGFTHDVLNQYVKSLEKPEGIILVTGPTGSGKTTTMYSSLMTYNHSQKNIMTAEDPVEYRVPTINQIQVRTTDENKTTMSFSKILRSFLRHNPDIVLIGEIRDKETAEVAVSAAQTGHLVFSTLHTPNALGTLNRMVDLGPDRIITLEALNTIISQRLIRKTCPECGFEGSLFETGDVKRNKFLWSILSEKDQERLKRARFRFGAGCSKCYHTGYSGQTATIEMIVVDEEVKSFYSSYKDPIETATFLREKKGYKSMWELALDLVADGVTTLEEIVRTVPRT